MTLSLHRPVVLIPARFYLPAYKAGGPIQSLAALCQTLGDAYDFRIITGDRDFSETKPFEGVRGGWDRVSGGHVRYLADGERSICAMIRIIRKVGANALYLNSCFDPLFSLLPLLSRFFGLMRAIPVILAPRGELSPGALAQKTRKKEFYLRWAGHLGLYRDVIWHASTGLERDEILAVASRFPGICSSTEHIRVARNLVLLGSQKGSRTLPKKAGVFRAIFLSRISPKKNLMQAIRLLGQVRGRVSLDVYGVMDPETYWAECLRTWKADAAPIDITYRGPVEHAQVPEIFSQYDAFVFPTLGENFGHAILESLTAGCPVLVSDRTPWRGLAGMCAGWDLALEDKNAWLSALQQVADMDEAEHSVWRKGARELGRKAVCDPKAEADHRALFHFAVQGVNG